MAWFKMHQESARHPKLKRLARGLEISKPAAIGHLFLLWSWAMDYAPDGDISGIDAEDIAGAAEWDGDADTFIAALLSCGIRGGGFLDRTEDGGFILHDWEENIGDDLERRRRAAEKLRKYRAKGKSDFNDTCNGYVTVTSPLRNGYITGEGDANIKISDKDLLELHEKRLRRILEAALSGGCDTIILGAFGCGASKNDPELVAQANRNVAGEYLHAFKNIEYAIYSSKSDERNYKVFDRVMGDISGV